jgi:ATP/maltotriose-dependent transcriptional regulator MalT
MTAVPHGESRGLPRTYVSRQRLLRRMSDGLHCRLTVVCADAGYGKTTLVAEFVASAQIPAAWCQLEDSDRDIARLAAHLQTSLRDLAAEPSEKGPRRGESRKHKAVSVDILSAALIKEAVRIGSRPVLLILDDYDKVNQEADVDLLLGKLIENSPPNLHFVVVSRSVPHLPVARLRARQEYSALGEADLAFTPDETARFLRSESGLDLDDDAVALVHERTEGWAAGIAMVSQSLRYGQHGRVMDILADPAASAWLVYDYLAEEVFDRQEPKIQNFLIKTSILGTLTAPACNWLLDATSSQSILLTLEESGLFTTSVGVSKEAFRYHQLFRESLSQKLYQLEPQSTIEELHGRAAEFYRREGMWYECVHHLLKAGAPERAAEVVEAIGERYLFSGFFQTVDYWLRSLPQDLSSSRPPLLVLKGRLSHLMARNDEALRLLERGLHLFQAASNEQGQASTLGEIGFVRYRMGHLRQSLCSFDGALEMSKDDAMARSELLVMQAQVLRDAGELQRCEESCRASLAELSRVEDDPRQLRGESRAMRNLAKTSLEKGDLRTALQLAQDARCLCVTHHLGEYEETWVLIHLGAIRWASGQLDDAIELLNRALTMSGHYIDFQRHTIGLWLGNSLRDSDRYAEADSAYEHTIPVGQLEREFLRLMADRDSPVSAESLDVCGRFSSSESLVVKSTAEVVRAVVYRRMREPSLALDHIREAVRLLKAHGFRLRLASALLHKSYIEHELASLADSRDSLSQAFELSSQGGYYHFFWWDPDVIAYSCRKGLTEGIWPEYASELMSRRLGRRSLPLLAPLLHDGNAEVRKRAQRALSSLSQQASGGSPASMLVDCPDLQLRARLIAAVSDGLVSAEGLQILRSRHGLSWREADVFIEYYLRAAAGLGTANAQLREECACRLGISENTVRCHVNRIRSKLPLPPWAVGRRVLDWVRQEGLAPIPRKSLPSSPP